MIKVETSRNGHGNLEIAFISNDAGDDARKELDDILAALVSNIPRRGGFSDSTTIVVECRDSELRKASEEEIFSHQNVGKAKIISAT